MSDDAGVKGGHYGVVLIVSAGSDLVDHATDFEGQANLRFSVETMFEAAVFALYDHAVFRHTIS